MVNPFADIVDEAPADAHTTRALLLTQAKRGFAPLRKSFVQKPQGGSSRASVLADMVTSRQERPLDALLLLHALEPILSSSPLALGIWARLLTRGNTPCTPAAASQAFNALVQRQLITRSGTTRRPEVWPLLEDGTNARPWTRPGRDEERGKGYFTIPYAYWTEGLVDQLTFPGKAMFLIMLSETTQNTTFTMAVERAPQWYGISERTAERGYQQLDKAGVLLQHRQVVVDPRSPTGLRPIYHRALTDPYSTDSRAQMQRVASRGAALRGGGPADSGAPSTAGPDQDRAAADAT